MQIIRDEHTAGIFMIPLFQQYNLHRCNVKGCGEKQTTIVTGFEGCPKPFALCESHYNEAKENRRLECTLEFD